MSAVLVATPESKKIYTSINNTSSLKSIKINIGNTVFSRNSSEESKLSEYYVPPRKKLELFMQKVGDKYIIFSEYSDLGSNLLSQ